MRNFFYAVALTVSVATGACSTPKPRAPESVLKEQAPRKEPQFFDDLELSRDQRDAILSVLDKLYDDFEEYDRLRLVLLDRTTAQIRAGELRREELLPLAEETIVAFNDALPSGIEAMQRLHDLLTREEREKLVKLFTTNAHLSEEEKREARNNRLAKVLDLTAAQKSRIYPSLLALYIRHWGVIGRLRGALDEAKIAFVEDSLDAKELAIAGELELLAIGEVIFDALEIGMNQLTPEQQQTLAALLDAQLRSPNPTTSDEPS